MRVFSSTIIGFAVGFAIGLNWEMIANTDLVKVNDDVVEITIPSDVVLDAEKLNDDMVGKLESVDLEALVAELKKE